MYFDEDGDLAHEFYEEIFLDRQGKKRVMRKQERNLIAQVKGNFYVLASFYMLLFLFFLP